MERIIKISGNMLDDVLDFVAQYPFKPYHFYNFDNVRIEKYFRSCILELHEQDENLDVLVNGSGKIIGLSSWSGLHWDSQQLGKKVGQINLIISSPGQYEEEYKRREILLKQILYDIVDAQLDYLIVRFFSADHSLMHLLEDYGFITLDCVTTFFMELTSTPKVMPNSANCNIREAENKDLSGLKRVAYSSYVFDRFHSDPIISFKSANELHAAWTENCFLGDAADVVLVAEQDGMILGYIACKINRKAKECLNVMMGNIVLIATSKERQRQGIAQALIHKALGWLKNKSVDLIEVTTQIQNIPALRLYQKIGFKIASSSITMRRYFGDQSRVSKNTSV